jgi:hypothetical protein
MVGRRVNHLPVELDATARQLSFRDRAPNGAALQNGAAAHGSGQPATGYLDLGDLRTI